MSNNNIDIQQQENRRQLPVYSENPFINGAMYSTEEKQVHIGPLNALDIYNGDAKHTVMRERKVMNSHMFTKFYDQALIAMTDISRAALKLFYHLVTLMKMNSDVIQFSAFIYAKENDLSHSYVSRLTKDLAEKKFIAKSTVMGQYFVNIQMVCKGDRIYIMREIIKSTRDNNDIEMNENFDNKTLPKASNEQPNSGW